MTHTFAIGQKIKVAKIAWKTLGNPEQNEISTWEVATVSEHCGYPAYTFKGKKTQWGHMGSKLWLIGPRDVRYQIIAD